MSIFVRESNSEKEPVPFVNVNGSWKNAKNIYAKVNGSWKQVFAAIPDAMSISHKGVHSWQINNFLADNIYTVTSGSATISSTGAVKMSRYETITITVAKYSGGPTKAVALTSLKYTYHQGQPQCHQVTFACVGGCGGLGCGCTSRGCGCACTYYPSGSCAGKYGYQTCDCTGCPQIKNGTPSGYHDSGGEWWKIVQK